MKRSLMSLISAVLLGLGITPLPTAAQNLSCEGLSFVFFPGGPEGGPFASIVYNGATAAEELTGCRVEYVWSDWNPEKMVRQLGEAIARQPDGISIMGHPGEEALGRLVDDARKQGIIVTTSNVDLPTLEQRYKASGFGYVGQKLYESGYTLGMGTVDQCGLKAGDKALVWGLLGQPGRGQRTKGIVDALKKAGMNVAYLEISDEVNKDAAQGTPAFTAFSAANPDLKAVVTDHGALTSTVGRVSESGGGQTGRDLRRRIRSVGADRAGHPGRMGCGGPRPTAVPPGIPADYAAVPGQEVRICRHEHRHGGGVDYAGQCRTGHSAGCQGDPIRTCRGPAA